MFAWSVWNGATYYIDVFGTRFQKELEILKKDVAKWQVATTSGAPGSPPFSPSELDVKTPGLHAAAASMAEIVKNPMLDLDDLSGESAKDKLPGIDGGIGTDTVEMRPKIRPEETKKDQ